MSAATLCPLIPTPTTLIACVGFAPNRADLQTGLNGVDSRACCERGRVAAHHGLDFLLISFKNFEANKPAAERPKDLHDLESLR